MHGAKVKIVDMHVGGFGDGSWSDLCKTNFGTPAGGDFVSFILTTV
jgi:hypothetical protein